MPDLITNRALHLKRYEHAKLVALSHIHAREIRIMELEEEIARSMTDIEAQKKVIIDNEFNIQLQLKAIEEEKAAANTEPKNDETATT